MFSTLYRSAFAVLALFLLSVVVAPAVALASHVRHADIVWRKPNPSTAPNTVEFVVNFTFRGTSAETFYTGDGQSYRVGNGAANTTLVANGTDASGSSFYTYRTVINHTYASNTAYVGYIQSGARIGNLNNGANGSYRMAVDVDLRPGTSAAPNTAGPQTASNALISLQAGTQVEYIFPMNDPDGDPVTCRIETQAESLIPGPNFGGTSPIVDTFNGACRVRWNLVNASTNTTLHSLPIRMESIHGGLVSSAVIDIIALTSNIAPPICTGSTSLTVGVGETATASVTGIHGANGSGNLRFDAIGAPPGSSVTPTTGSSGAAPLNSTISWTPGASDSGTTRLILMTYTNPANSSASCSVSIFTRPECGNGVIETGESCDDGNTSNMDECTSECRFRPVAADDNFSTPEDTIVIVDPMANDPTASERPVTIMIHHETHHGSMVVLDDGRVQYTPDLNFHGVDDFGYMIFDGVAMSEHTDVEIVVTPVNDAPEAVPGEFETPEETAIEMRIFVTDIDGGDVGFDMLTTTTHGVLTGTPPVLTYTPGDDFNGQDSFTFRANDGELTSDPATVVIDVTPVNDAPLADDSATTLAEDTPTGISLTGSDPENDSLTFSVVGAPNNGTLSGTAPNLTYTPNGNFNGTDSFTYRSNDGALGSEMATVSLTVTPVNDAPVAADGSESTQEDEDVSFTLVGTDVDLDSLDYSVATTPSNGMLSGTAPDLTYTPFPNFEGSDSFTFTVSDGELGSNTATVQITVAAVNDPPVADAQSSTLDEDTSQSLTLVGSDLDADSLTFAVVSGPSNGQLSGNAPNLTYTPNEHYNGPDSFTFRTNDGSVDSETATVDLTVTPVNDAPVAADDTLNVEEDGDVGVTLLAIDVEDDALDFMVVAGPTNGSLSGTAPDLTYTPDGDYNGPDSFTFTATDGDLTSNTATVDITVAPANDAPTADEQSVTVDEDASLDVVLTGADIDADDLTFEVMDEPSNGELTGTAPDLTYTPDENFNGEDSFTFRTNDGELSSATETVTITVTPVNDAPLAVNDEVETEEDASIEVLLGATDIDSDDFTFTVQTEPTNGSLTGTAPDLTYVPNDDFNGEDSFTFIVNDGELDSEEGTVTVTVTPVNDAPVISDADAVTLDDPDSADVEFLVSDIDNEADELTVEVTSSDDAIIDPDLITITDEGGERTLTVPSNGAVGTVTLTVTVTDPDGLSSSTTFDVTVTCIDDLDDDGVCDGSDTDLDGDGVDNEDDNCPDIVNDGQADLDEDMIGDDCDEDIDGDGLTNIDEEDRQTDPRVVDTDGDGCGDGQEVNDGSDPLNGVDCDAGLLVDTDEDGLTDFEETTIYETDPEVADTDEDGLDDGEEVLDYETDPLDADTDDDDLTDGEEVMDTETDPLVDDTDGDGCIDGGEINDGTDPLNPIDCDEGLLVDTDEDGITDYEEITIYETDPLDPDTDSDGLLDGEEVFTYETDPLDPDTDDDACTDGEEVDGGTDPNYPIDCGDGLLVDTDDDGIPDIEEIEDHETDPLLDDTDGDGISDGDELDQNSDPLDPEDGVLTYVGGGCACQSVPMGPTGAALLLPLLLVWAGRRRNAA